MIGDFIYDNPLLVVGVLFSLIFGALGYAIHDESKHKDAACEKMWASARTSADTIAVLAKCELGDEPQVIPMPVVIPVR